MEESKRGQLLPRQVKYRTASKAYLENRDPAKDGTLLAKMNRCWTNMNPAEIDDFLQRFGNKNSR